MSELLHHFGVDWKLLAAQAVNFGVLLAVLYKFAYKPILHILNARREKIEKGLSDANLASERLARAEELGERKINQAHGQALEIVNQAEATGRVRKDEIVQDAAKKSEAMILEAKRAAREEKAKMAEEFVGDAEEIVRLGIARVLGKMPAEKRDQELIHEAMQALKSAK